MSKPMPPFTAEVDEQIKATLARLTDGDAQAPQSQGASQSQPSHLPWLRSLQALTPEQLELFNSLT